MARTIIVKGDPLHKEGVAKVALQPGHLIMIASDSTNADSPNLSLHSPAGAPAGRNFVRERDWIGADTEETIAIGETVEYISSRPGDEIRARTTGTIAAGALLMSAGDGTLSTVSAATEDDPAGTPIGIAMEANDGTKPFTRIEVL